MKELCAQCNICSFMPAQQHDRIFSIPGDEENPPSVLVIDDAFNGAYEYSDSIAVAHNLLGGLVDFTYTSTIRCRFKEGKLTPEQLTSATSRCSVWTNMAAENFKVVLSTRRGLDQLKAGKGKKEGDVFKSGRLGLVLVIPRLIEVSGTVERAYHTKTQRLLKEAGLVK